VLTALNDYLSCRHQKKVRTPYVPITNTMNINTTRFVNNFITKELVRKYYNKYKVWVQPILKTENKNNM